MGSLAVSADGDFVFMALEDSGGNQLVAKAARSDLSTWSAAYQPGAGSASNVVATGNLDKMVFFGNFGTDVVIISHTVSTGANVDISPASLGAKVVNTLQVNPSDDNEIVAAVNTDQDLIHTTDLGSNWETWNSALGFDATALWVLWSGPNYPHRLFVAGDNGANLDLMYSPNEGANVTDYAGASLAAAANIGGVEV